MRRISVKVFGAIVVMGLLLVGVLSGQSQAALPRDCDKNAIINCGAVTADELNQKYTKNQTGDLQTIYSYYGISAEMITAGAPVGEVHKDGTVTLNGQVVATDAMSIGRQNMFSGTAPLMIGGKTYYNTPPSRSFARESITAFIFLDQNGQFIGAILTSCGNPVSAKPITKTPPPQPPKVVVTPPPAQPIYRCDALMSRVVNAEARAYVYDLAYTAENGAALKSVDYDFGDGLGRENIKPEELKDITHTYAAAGTYTATATLHFTIGQEIKDSNCQTTITTGPTTPPPPPQLPKTGPFDFVGVGFVMASIFTAGWYYMVSRRDFITLLLNR